MSKRKADGALLFEKCQGIKGLADNHLRAVIARLSGRDDAEVHAKKKSANDSLMYYICYSAPSFRDTRVDK